MSLNLKDRWMTHIMTGGLKSGNQHEYKGRMAMAATGTRVTASICIPLLLGGACSIRISTHGRHLHHLYRCPVSVKMIPDGPDDLWLTYNLIAPGGCLSSCGFQILRILLHLRDVSIYAIGSLILFLD
ncbi:putative pelota/DOM34 domain-containing protein [Helianthus annuus]|nr:putative pelota/DOM34 domain-containing protein [Helianthus annuus]